MRTRLLYAARHFAHERGGATAIEYSLIAASLAVVIVAAAALLGDGIMALFNQVATAVGG